MPVIEVANLSFAYGRHEALHDVTLQVPEGAVYGLLGPNGSGKTTLMQLLMGLRRPDAGSIRIFGMPRGQLSLRQRARVTYVADGRPLPGWMRLALAVGRGLLALSGRP